ncbi:MAG: hypothetical protein WAP74_04160 [Patescibacteria group bacterium]
MLEKRLVELLVLYPQIRFQQFQWLRENQIAFFEDRWSEPEESLQVDLAVSYFEVSRLSQWLVSVLPSPDNFSAVLYLGNGARCIRDWLRRFGWKPVEAQEIFVEAHRYWQPGSAPWASVAHQPIPQDGQKLIIDDVFCSGATLATMLKNYPDSNSWHFACWALHAPRRNDQYNCLDRLTNCYAAVVIGGEKRPPTFTLSSLKTALVQERLQKLGFSSPVFHTTA